MPVTTQHYLPLENYLALGLALAKVLPENDRLDIEAIAHELLGEGGVWDQRVLDDLANLM